jgi:hypothetical protein
MLSTKGRKRATEDGFCPMADPCSPVFAFPRARKEPMTNAAHVRDAMARFDQVKDVTDAERDLAFANIQKAANHFGIQMKEKDWHQFGS